MDSMLLSSGRISSSTPLPLVLSYSSSALLEKKSISAKTHLSFPIKQAEKTPFLGRSLVLDDRKLELDKRRNTHLPFHPIKAAVKRRKELPLDNVIQRDKKLKLVLKIRKILVGQPDRIMSVKELGRFKRDLGIPKKRRLIALLKRFPAIFEIVEEGVYLLQFKLTPEADRLYLEELRVRNEMEGLLVTKLRKLLMMSLEKRVLLEKIAHLRTDFGLPLEFRDTVCQRYPQYFKIVKTDRGPALELTSWDPELAVSAAELSEEENRAKEIEEMNLIIDRPPKFKRVKLPKGLNLSKGDIRRLAKFREIPYVSPYSDFSELKAGTLEKEKHACGVVHEILSLTVEKRTLVDHFTHFREEFRFSQQLRGMLIRHPDMFYVSLKGERDSVFLREAYRDSHLIDKDRLLLIKEKMRALVAVPRFPNGRAVRITMWDVVLEMLLAAQGKVTALANGELQRCRMSWLSTHLLEQAWKEMAQTLTEANFGNMKEVLESEPPKWLPDSASSSCMLCSVRFHPIMCSRHHCRFCGGLFCSECSKGRSLLPVNFRTGDPRRVCDVCCVKLEPVQKCLMDQVSRASQLPTHDLTDLSTLRSWVNFPWGQSMEYEIYKSTNTIRGYSKVGSIRPERSIPDTILRHAKGLAIITVVKVGLMATYNIGTGLVIARKEDGSWSAPSAISSFGVGWGAQVGGELTDYIIVLRTKEAVTTFSGNVHFSIGAGLSAAVGIVGRAAEADLRAGDGGYAACYTYSCSKGAFVGCSLEGSMVATRTSENSRFYGSSSINASDILLGSLPRPPAAASLYHALSELFQKFEK